MGNDRSSGWATEDEYGSIAGVYDLVVGLPLRRLRRRLSALIADDGAGTLVEIGCGTGELLNSSAPRGQIRIGIDRSPAMLRRATRFSNGNRSFICADARRLPLSDASAELVIFSFILHELDPALRGPVWEEALRILRPGGRIFVADYGPPVGGLWPGLVNRIIRVVERLAGSRHHAAYRDWMDRGALPGFLARQGAPESVAARALAGQVLITRVTPDGR